MSQVDAPITTERVGSEIFQALKRHGPLCASQISVELVLPLREIVEALHYLERKGLVERRPDPEATEEIETEEIPWGLPTLHLGGM